MRRRPPLIHARLTGPNGPRFHRRLWLDTYSRAAGITKRDGPATPKALRGWREGQTTSGFLSLFDAATPSAGLAMSRSTTQSGPGPPAHAASHRPTKFAKIGRASCRERVCQYV